MEKEKYIKDEDYYIKNGRVIFTAKYLEKKKKCCGGKCEHCPYVPPYEKDNTSL